MSEQECHYYKVLTEPVLGQYSVIVNRKSGFEAESKKDPKVFRGSIDDVVNSTNTLRTSPLDGVEFTITWISDSDGYNSEKEIIESSKDFQFR